MLTLIIVLALSGGIRMKFPCSHKFSAVLAVVCAVFAHLSSALAADETFDVARFQVVGNTILPQERIDALVAPYVGQKRVYGDLQKVLEALEGAYRSAGWGTVQVYAPEQELTGGVVKVVVNEGAISQITVSGNKYFTEQNVLASLPRLQPGTAPNLREVSENVQLANESPAKQVDVTFAESEDEGKVDARVSVVDESPEKYIVTLDNTGERRTTGQYRLGVAYRDANLLGGDETLTLGYTSSPDLPPGVKMDVYSVGLRVPFYKLGDSLDVIWGYNNVNMPANVVTPGGGPLAMNGKGDVLALRWNHIFSRDGEYASRLVLGYDQKNTLNPCASSGAPLITVGCVTVLTTPVSATYSGQWQKPNLAMDFNIGAEYNAALYGAQDAWRYDYAANGRSTERNFLVIKSGGSYFRALPGDWQVRAALNAQYADTPLPAGEQLGLVGSTAVRGFAERALTADSGWVANLEAYTPDVMPLLAADAGKALPGSLRLLTFYDFAYSWNRPKDNQSWTTQTGAPSVTGITAVNERIALASIGLGLRYALGKDISAKFDWARILESAPASRLAATTPVDDKWRVHFALSVGF